MSTQVKIQFPVITYEERLLTLLDVGELVIEKETNTLYVGDGKTKGGVKIGEVPEGIVTSEDLQGYVQASALKALAYQAKIDLSTQTENSLDWQNVSGNNKPADGATKNLTYYQSSAPTTPNEGDFWIKTDEQNQLYIYTNGSFKAGKSGSDAPEKYIWVKYADTPTTGMSDSPTGKAYMGVAYNKTTAVESTAYADYSWSLIQGPTGAQGPTGPTGPQGPQGITGYNLFEMLPSYSNSNAATITYENGCEIKLYSASDAAIGMVAPAFYVGDGRPVQISFEYKASSTYSSGFYARIQEYDADLPNGKTHVCNDALHSRVQEDTRQITGILENKAISTTWVKKTYIYTPTSTAKWASIVFMNWSGMSTAALYIKNIDIRTKISADILEGGVLSSQNWGTTLGSYYDLNNGTFKLGGSSNPKLEFDGTNLSMSGSITFKNSVNAVIGVVSAEYIQATGYLQNWTDPMDNNHARFSIDPTGLHNSGANPNYGFTLIKNNSTRIFLDGTVVAEKTGLYENGIALSTKYLQKNAQLNPANINTGASITPSQAPITKSSTIGTIYCNYPLQYTRVGNCVHFSGKANVNIIATTTSYHYFTIASPINSAMGTNDLNGTVSGYAASALGLLSGYCWGETNKIVVTFQTLTTGSHWVSFSGKYIIK